jgi:hypothetical protein
VKRVECIPPWREPEGFTEVAAVEKLALAFLHRTVAVLMVSNEGTETVRGVFARLGFAPGFKDAAIAEGAWSAQPGQQFVPGEDNLERVDIGPGGTRILLLAVSHQVGKTWYRIKRGDTQCSS